MLIDIFQVPETTIMHIRKSEGHITQTRDFEFERISLTTGDAHATNIIKCRIQR